LEEIREQIKQCSSKKERETECQSHLDFSYIHCLWYQAYAGEPVLKGEDFKQYVNLLREKSLTYKQKRADLSDLKAEYGVLERTLEVLKYVYIF